MNASRPDKLECATALERLDAVWLDPLPDEPLDAESSAAWEHVQECSACWAALQQRRDVDQQISDMMQSVSVPSSLKERLLAAAVAESSVQTLEVATAGNVSAVVSLHRRVWAITTAAAMLVIAAGGAWLWTFLSSEPIALQALRELTPIEPTGLVLAGGSADVPALPATWLRTRGLDFKPPHWFKLPNSKSNAAWFAFELRADRQPIIRGVLLATPKSNLVDPPPELFVAPSVGYTTRDGKPVAVAAWSEHGVVYVCFVPGDSKSLERLLRITAPSPA